MSRMRHVTRGTIEVPMPKGANERGPTIGDCESTTCELNGVAFRSKLR
jgi:hypothetical protein